MAHLSAAGCRGHAAAGRERCSARTISPAIETTGSSRLTTDRTVFDLFVERRQAELTDRIIIEVEADGFLYNMVRNIVGTLVAVGKGKAAADLARRSARTARPHESRHDRAGSGIVFGGSGIRRRFQIAECRLRIAESNDDERAAVNEITCILSVNLQSEFRILKFPCASPTSSRE